MHYAKYTIGIQMVFDFLRRGKKVSPKPIVSDDTDTNYEKILRQRLMSKKAEIKMLQEEVKLKEQEKTLELLKQEIAELEGDEDEEMEESPYGNDVSQMLMLIKGLSGNQTQNQPITPSPAAPSPNFDIGMLIKAVNATPKALLKESAKHYIPEDVNPSEAKKALMKLMDVI
jgi:hypothetical protein